MNDLLTALEAAIAETERIAQVARGVRLSGGRWSHSKLGKEENLWGTVVDAKGTIVVYGGLGLEGWGTAAWAADHIALNDPERILRRVARDRKLLELHRPTLEIVEWPHALDERGKNWTCPSCHPANPTDPTEWRPPIGAAHLLPEGFVPNYVLAPCPTLAALTEDYEIEVSDHV